MIGGSNVHGPTDEEEAEALGERHRVVQEASVSVAGEKGAETRAEPLQQRRDEERREGGLDMGPDLFLSDGGGRRRLHSLDVTTQWKRADVSSTCMRISRTASSGNDTMVTIATVSSIFLSVA